MYGYDTYDRPLTTTYPDGDVVQVVGYDSRGMATGLTSKLGANAITLVDNVQYDAAGRLVQLRYLYGGGVYVNHYYRPWTGSSGNSNGRYWGMNVGTTAGGYDLATTWYGYDTFGNVVGHAISERGSTIDNVTFTYDDQQRVTSAYGQTFKWRPSGNFEEFDGVDYSYSLLHPHAVEGLNGLDRYDYDLNGNMVVRWRADKPLQTLKWNADNRLGQVSHPGFTESYLYDENGVRIRKTSNGVSTFYPFGGYAVTGGEVTKHYFFNGEALALRKGSGVYFLYHDRLGSTIRATDAYNQVSGQQGYDAFGGKRRSSGELPTDYLYTGQEEDSGTGLLYYNARYYDPQLGQFLSPDTIVPEPTSFLDYNRYLYARGNPVIFNDPSGHETSKPEWWPPFLIYPFDLPDSSATEDVRTWFSENNVPTIVAYNVGGDVGAGIILGASASFEVQGSFNIWSGELALTRSTSFATRIGTPQASVNIHRGGTVVAGASSTQASFLGASRNITLDADVEMGGQVSGFGTWSQAVQYEDRNGNANFDLLDENGFSEPVYLGQPYIDPEFNRTVDALSIGTGAGLDLASIPLLPMRVGPIKWR